MLWLQGVTTILGRSILSDGNVKEIKNSRAGIAILAGSIRVGDQSLIVVIDCAYASLKKSGLLAPVETTTARRTYVSLSS